MSTSKAAPVARTVAVVVLSVSPVQADSAARVSVGETIYGDYCSSCHGEGLKNTSGGVTFDLRRLRPEDRDRFFSSVLEGKRQMPPWRGVLDTEQIESIWTYVRAKVDQ